MDIESLGVFVYHDTSDRMSNHYESAEFHKFPRLWASPYSRGLELFIKKQSIYDKHLRPFVLQPSLFHSNKVPPTIYFKTKRGEEMQPPVALPKKLQRLFKWRMSTITPNSIKNCILFMKFETVRSDNVEDTLFIGSWFKHMCIKEFRKLTPWRKVNHYPGSFHLGRKDKLSLNLRAAANRCGPKEFGVFHPETYIMPRDYELLKQIWDQSPNDFFIMKPPASARGNGIQVISGLDQIPREFIDVEDKSKSTLIIQKYLSKPCLLENGLKFDLRIYVLLTSIDPLRLYIHEEGLVRFASSRYDISDLETPNHFMHLTNYFVNKKNLNYKVNNDANASLGSKWSLKKLWTYLDEYHSDKVNSKTLRAQIRDIIIKTIVSCEKPILHVADKHCKNDYTSYELFGFDIILDENFKPWILEVNITPSLKSESELDSHVKYSVIEDMFNIVGYNLPPTHNATVNNSIEHSRLVFDSRYYIDLLTQHDIVKRKAFKELMLKSDYFNALNFLHSNGNSLGNDNDDEESLEYGHQQVDGTTRNLLINNIHIDHQNINLDATCFYTSIIDDLTQNDMRVLMISEDEYSRRGKFERVFPTTSSHDYLKFFDGFRYNNLLLDAWERQYSCDRSKGINLLSKCANFLDEPPNEHSYQTPLSRMQ